MGNQAAFWVLCFFTKGLKYDNIIEKTERNVFERGAVMMNKNLAHQVALYGMLIALAFVLSYVEALLPISMGIPGIKLGLANLVTVVGLYTVGIKGTVAVSLIRIVLVSFTFGNMFSLIYSLGGWSLSIFFMTASRRSGWFGAAGTSILGGVAHNIGQICMAAVIVRQTGVFFYLPALLFSGTIAGLAIGITGGIIVKRLKAITKNLQ